MIDLHLHLDGSVSPETAILLAKKQGLSLPAETPGALKAFLQAPPKKSLVAYLESFKLPLSLLQTKEALFLAAYELLKTLSIQGLIYAEIRFAPQLHTLLGMSQAQAVAAAAEAVERARRDFGIKANLILCCMRGRGENLITIDTAAYYLGGGVCAADLAGAEELDGGSYGKLFEAAAKKGVPYTIHAGEAAGAESVKAAIALGASRIGHGVRSGEDESLMRLLKEKGIPLEMCPTSNLQTGAVPDIKQHPAVPFLRRGLKVTINTDNMTVSDTTLEKEFFLLEKHFAISQKEKELFIKNSIEAAFISKSEKSELFLKAGIAPGR